ncbi:hypothetical protein GGI42DRAFT_359223 [Trichoderma sp. SZMC 28013]
MSGFLNNVGYHNNVFLILRINPLEAAPGCTNAISRQMYTWAKQSLKYPILFDPIGISLFTLIVALRNKYHKWTLNNITEGPVGHVVEGRSKKCLGYERNYSFKITTSSTWPKGGHANKITHEEGRSDGVIDQTRRLAEPNLHAPLCMQLGQTAVVCDAFSGVFMDLLFPKKTDMRQNVNSSDSWISSLATLISSRDETLNQGLLALYTGFVGRKNGDAALINRSAELYSNALHASIMIFSRVELLAGEGANGGYMAHIKGGLHLVQRFGANFPCSDLTRVLVQRLRYLGFYDAARHRRGFFMCHAPYNTLCLAKKEDPNYLTHKAIEAVITLPTLCEYADRLDATVFQTEKKVRRGLLTTQYLLNCASIVENNLDQWLSEMTAATPCPIVVEVSDAEINISPQPHEIGVTAAQASDLWMLHWSLTIRFNLLIRQLQTRSYSTVRWLENLG